MRTIVKSLNELTVEEYRYCYNANLNAAGRSGRMRDDLVDGRDCPELGSKAILLWDDSLDGAARLLGWTLLTRNGTKTSAMFWVKSRNRNNGYGTILMQEVKKIDKRPTVYPWSREAGGFFSKFKVVPTGNGATYHIVNKPKVC